ncbi:MAG: hypothetical protein AB1725_08325 [Armatimonadota bacterium]
MRRILALLIVLGLALAQAGALARACTCKRSCESRCCPTEEHKPCKVSIDAATDPVALAPSLDVSQFAFVLSREEVLHPASPLAARGFMLRKGPPRIRAPEPSGNSLRAPPYLA